MLYQGRFCWPWVAALMIRVYLKIENCPQVSGDDFMTCDFCRQEKLDSQLRPLLRVIDDLGHRTINPFHGTLCDNCYGQVQVFGTPIHGWVLNLIKKVDLETTQRAK